MTERATLRLHPPVILWWVWVAFVLANVVDYAAQGLPSARFGALLAAVLLLVTGVVYTLALRPKVIEDGDGLTVVNPFRVHRLPWPRSTRSTPASGSASATPRPRRPAGGRATSGW